MMTPTTVSVETNHKVKPSLTYKVDWENNRIVGTTDDDAETLYQFVYKALNTDKYAHEVYDWLYGNELYKLVGKDYQYIVTALPDIIERALLTDDRVKEISNYEFNQLKVDEMEVSFDVIGKTATINYTTEVNI